MAQDDNTIIQAAALPSGHGLALDVTYPLADGAYKTVRLKGAFQIGREKGCLIRISDKHVSRQHVDVFPDQGQWWIRDLGSRNGTYLNGARIQLAPLKQSAMMELGVAGPAIRLALADPDQALPPDQPVQAEKATKPTPENPPTDASTPAQEPSQPPTEVAQRSPTFAQKQPSTSQDIAQRYFDPAYKGPVGEHTAMVRQAFQRVSKRRSRGYRWFISLILLLLIGAGSIAVYQHYRWQRVQALAIEIFYSMKTMELQVVDLEYQMADVEGAMHASARAKRLAEIALKRQQLAKLQERYDDFLEQIGTSEPLDDEDRLILRVARLFGECELNVPEDFMDEVKSYIAKWQSTSRLANAIRRLEKNGYAPIIYRAMTSNGLPPQFLYLGLQESGFQEQAVGPITRYGHAKGIWQFIPATGSRYGLRIGPLKDFGLYDPEDERFHFTKATEAAARYLRDIYKTEAQASGLLVMASYNWGEGNIRRLLRKMPENPRERNFWELLKHYKIPDETYNYVFYIFSAAVIGENPELFGFSFKNPLAGTPTKGIK